MILMVAGVKSWNDWDAETQKPGKRRGTVYTVLKYKSKGPVLIDVKVEGATEVVDMATVKAAIAAQSAVYADFVDMDDDQYIGRDGVLHRTGTAKEVVLVSGGTIDL